MRRDLKFTCLMLLAGCLSPPVTHPPGPLLEPSPGTVLPPPLSLALPVIPVAEYRSNWTALANGASPAEMRDVAGESPPRVWLYSGDWAINRQTGQTIYAVSPYAGSYPEPLTFRRYSGAAFGLDGDLPARYSIRAVGASTGGSKRFGGVGELAMQVVYGDPTHYVEILQNDAATQIWWADGAQPQSAEGWHSLAAWPHRYLAGQWIGLGADVNLLGGTLRAYRDGLLLGQVDLPIQVAMSRPQMCLRATGNGEAWRFLTIRQLGY